MRRKVVAGNWKMNKTPNEARELITELKPLVQNDDVDVIFCVPFIDIPVAIEMLKGSNVSVGAQNMHFEDKGAFTGEISAKMLYESGVEYVIIGHSERRQYFAETDETVNRKIRKAFENELVPIVCCGETLEQREEGITLSWIRGQITKAFENVASDQAAQTIIAYEPIWAIGTGKVATKEQAEEVCLSIRETICDLYDGPTAEAVRILYGGSVTGDSANELFNMENIDGGLVGGASLKPDFGRIVFYNK